MPALFCGRPFCYNKVPRKVYKTDLQTERATLGGVDRMERTHSFGYWLRRRRKALDLTQDELAQQVGCAVGTIKSIETDARRPSKQLAERLADLLQLAPEERTAFLMAARGQLAVDQLNTA